LEAACLIEKHSADVHSVLVASARNYPSDWAMILSKLCKDQPVNRELVLAVMVATIGGAPAHFHECPSLFAGEPTEDDLPLLLELIDRIDYQCHGSTKAFELLADRLNTASISDSEHDRVRQSVLAVFKVESAVSAALAALALSKIEPPPNWIAIIGEACVASASLFEKITSGLTIPDEWLIKICGIAGSSTFVETRIAAAFQMVRLGKIDTAISIFRQILSNKKEVGFLVFRPKFLLLAKDQGLKSRIGAAIVLGLKSAEFADAVSLEGFYLASIVALPSLTPSDTSRLQKRLGMVAGSFGARLRLIWKLAVASIDADTESRIRLCEELVLCLPNERWLRELLLTAARDSLDDSATIRWLGDEMSFFLTSDPAYSERGRSELQARKSL
jgi:hypothetical protein